MITKTRLLMTIMLVAALGVTSGCTTVSRSLGKLTDNKYAEPRSGTVWVVPPPQLEPPRPEDKTVYISFRNISDAQSIQLRDELISAAKEQGWRVVNNPQSAKYRLRASLRFFGEVEPESGGAAVARGMGVIAGAAVGVGTYAAVSRATDSGLAGAAAGIGAGGLAAQGLSNASRPREWALIMDVVLEEYSAKPVEFRLSRGTSSGTGDAAGTGNSRMSSGGGTRTGNTSSGTITKRSNYFPHGIRLSAWANQMNMKQEEAMPLIREKVQKVAVQMLPQ